MARRGLPAARAAEPAASALAALARELRQIDRHVTDLEREMAPALARVAADHRESARNLVHYVALRQRDLRELQVQLQEHGLSSLGRSESCVRASLLEVALRVGESLAAAGDEGARAALAGLASERRSALDFASAKFLLHQHTRDLLGPRPDDRHIYVMATAPSAREADRAWMERMLRAGMNLLRINCAHESEAEWSRMLSALDAARRATGRECRVLMDLAGPKVRTGAIGGARRITSWRPAKDDVGEVVTPATVVVRTAAAAPTDGAPPQLALDPAAAVTLRCGDRLRFRDARGKQRELVVERVGAASLTASATQRAYVLTRARARVLREDERVGEVWLDVAQAPEGCIALRGGDELVLTARPDEGRPASRARDGSLRRAGRVSCTLPEALARLEPGHRVLFDDGKIEAVVDRVRRSGDFVLRVVRVPREDAKLRPEKGINLPDTPIDVPSLGADDLRALAFVAAHADAVSLSFVRRAEDVRDLHARLDRLTQRPIGVVLKIETRAGFDDLPRILLEGLRRPPLGVMIARGDLAVEVGFERLAEVQEEALWLCEASHVPAIWATQVLDTLARTGIPSRAEVTDAAASVAAECVMLNKGPFVDEAVRVLCDILRRMEKHHYKKRSLFRKLRVSTFARE